MQELAANAWQFLLRVGDVEFQVSEFEAIEEISTLYTIDLALASEQEVALADMAGQAAILKIFTETEDRFFHGIISEFKQTETVGRFFTYQARLVPQIFLLTLRQDCRIFQEKSVKDIVETILDDAGIPGDTFEFRLQGTPEPREYCVQYREKDLDFISRLLEEEGIFYFFEHSEEKTTLVFGDGTVNYVPIPGDSAEIEFHPERGMVPGEDYVYIIEKTRQIHSNKVTLRDIDFVKPSMDLTCPKEEGGDGPTFEVYDFPGEYKVKGRGDNLAQVRLDEFATFKERLEGRSNCPRFTTAHTFDLIEHDREDLNATHLLVRIYHKGVQPGVLEEHGGSGADEGYNNEFLAIPSETTYRPPQRTPKARVDGLQTAEVVGPDGEEIYTDEHGRVKVWFRWDHADKAIDKRSCWIRTCQIMAGKNWGGVWIPRIGHEVVVDFLEGNPDRPIIIGQVYNGANPPPYGLPGEKTKSTIKSNSSIGGDGFNEIRFEDKKGSEQVFVHAEKNYDQKVKNTQKEYVGNELHLYVDKKKYEYVEEDKHIHIHGAHNERVDGTCSLTVDGDLLEKIGPKWASDVQQEIHLKSGIKVVIEAGTEVTMKAGGSFVKCAPDGVTIKGAMVKINSGGTAGTGSGSSPEIPEDAKIASGDPGESASQNPPWVHPTTGITARQAQMESAAESNTPFCAECEAARQAQAEEEGDGGETATSDGGEEGSTQGWSTTTRSGSDPISGVDGQGGGRELQPTPGITDGMQAGSGPTREEGGGGDIDRDDDGQVSGYDESGAEIDDGDYGDADGEEHETNRGRVEVFRTDEGGADPDTGPI